MKSYLFYGAASVAAIISAGSGANAANVIDQEQTKYSVVYGPINGAGQTFTAGQATSSGAGILFQPTEPGGRLGVTLSKDNIGLGTFYGSDEAVGTGIQWLDAFWTPIQITKGSNYELSFSYLVSGSIIPFTAFYDTDRYAGGSLVVYRTAYPGIDLAFRTYSNASAAIPEPATWAMMIAGFGLAGAAVRSRKAGRMVAA